MQRNYKLEPLSLSAFGVQSAPSAAARSKNQPEIDSLIDFRRAWRGLLECTTLPRRHPFQYAQFSLADDAFCPSPTSHSANVTPLTDMPNLGIVALTCSRSDSCDISTPSTSGIRL
jgi:hypothetical protein